MNRVTAEIRHRGRLFALCAIACTSLSLSACGGTDSTSPPPVKQEKWATVGSVSWSLGHDNEGYQCYVIQVPSEQYITGFRLASPNPIQAEVQLSMSESALPLIPTNCSVATQAGRLIYASTKGTSAIEFPSGKGVHIPAGSYLLFNVHLTNPTNARVEDSTKIEGRVGNAADVTTPLTMFFAGVENLNIPADNLPHLQIGGCASTTDEHLVAVMPLMRDRGTHQAVKLVVGNDTTSILDAAYDPLHVSYSVFDSDVHVPVGGKIRVECTYVNDTGSFISFGDSSDSETCYAGFYHYATDAGSGDIYACANNHTPDFVHGEPETSS